MEYLLCHNINLFSRLRSKRPLEIITLAERDADQCIDIHIKPFATSGLTFVKQPLSQILWPTGEWVSNISRPTPINMLAIGGMSNHKRYTQQMPRADV